MNYCIEDLLTSGSVLIYCLKYLTSFVNIVRCFRVGAWKGFQAEEGTFDGWRSDYPVEFFIHF